MLRKLRGALVTALTWAIGWGIIALAAMGALWLIDPWEQRFLGTAGPVTLMVGLSGLIAGFVFAVVLGSVYRRRSLADLSASTMSLWGAGAALLVPLALLGTGLSHGVGLNTEAIVTALVAIAGVGAATAGGTIKLAQLGQGGGRRGTVGPGA